MEYKRNGERRGRRVKRTKRVEEVAGGGRGGGRGVDGGGRGGKRELEQAKDGEPRLGNRGSGDEKSEESNVFLAMTLRRRRRSVPDLFTLAAADTFLDFQNNATIKQRRRVRMRGKQSIFT